MKDNHSDTVRFITHNDHDKCTSVDQCKLVREPEEMIVKNNIFSSHVQHGCPV